MNYECAARYCHGAPQEGSSYCSRQCETTSYTDHKPEVITLCGSTRFKDQFMAMQQRETLLSKIVMTVGFFHHKEQVPITDKDKEMLDNLHLRKIDISDGILVINPNGYIGESTKREIAYAMARNKAIAWLEDGEAWLELNSHELGLFVSHFAQYDTIKKPDGVA